MWQSASQGKELNNYGEINSDMRVKLEYHGERRIVPIPRPVMISHLLTKIEKTFGEELSINFENGNLFLKIGCQADLDKAVALLDQTPHLTSLRLTLTPKETSQSPNNNVPSSRPSPVRTRSNPEYMTEEENDLIPVRPQSMFVPRNDILYGHSPPPGHHPAENNVSHSQQNGGGVFIPEERGENMQGKSEKSFSFEDPDPLAHIQESHEGMYRGASSLPRSESNRSFTSEDVVVRRHNTRHHRDRSRPLSDLTLDTDFYLEYDSDDPYRETMRHRSDWNINEDPVNNVHTYKWMDRHRDKFIPIERKTRSNSSVSEDSSSSSGFIYEIDARLSERFPYDNRIVGDRIMPDNNNRIMPVDNNRKTMQDNNRVVTENNNNFFMNNKTRDFDNRTLEKNRDNNSDYIELTQKANQMAISNNGEMHSTNQNNEIEFRWKKVRKIGSGAFGTVYLCVDLDTGKEAAMKCVETGNINSSTLKEVEILQQEIQLYETLKHERIVKYYGTLQANTSLSIFMEYMQGGSIHDKISKVGALNEEETSRYCLQILEGLSYLHNKNIIHRDVKGANILLDASDNCKLADFGSSKQIQTIRSKSGCKSVHGTPYWMSPEVINGGGYGRKADIWSLGCTAVEMLTTKPPWFQFEPMAALFKIATEPTLPTLPLVSTPKCRHFVDDCLQRDISSRPMAAELLTYSFVLK